MKKKLLSAIFAGMLTFNFFGNGDNAQAMSREEISKINVVTAQDFKYWNDNSPTKQKIVAFVQDVTNPNSPNFIPPEDRIATFDMDGTFYCETAPLYFQEMMFFHRVLEDKDYKAPKKYLDLAKKIYPKVLKKEPRTPAEAKLHFNGLTAVYAGMTPEEYRAYVRKFMDTEEIGLTNLKRGEAFYLPMVEIISYLGNNGFNVYIDSACSFYTTRELIEDVIPIPSDRILGSDFHFTSTKMGKDDPKDHFFDRNKEKIVISGKPLDDNAKTVKIFSIINQIGKYPVLAFGNSSGDSGMLEYTLQNPKYKSAAFYVLCDDVERELGNLDRAVKDKANADKRGWNTISMHDEFKTIYGDNVKRSQ